MSNRTHGGWRSVTAGALSGLCAGLLVSLLLVLTAVLTLRPWTPSSGTITHTMLSRLGELPALALFGLPHEPELRRLIGALLLGAVLIRAVLSQIIGDISM